MERIAIYLRKSRADLDAEARGEGETLSKHKKELLKLSKQKQLTIIKVYEEIVSGETVIHRPQMLKLLKAINKGSYEAVLCMDLDRLGRGNMQDQGLILETFKKSKTKIITPRKIYDLNNEFDEEYSEFETFMARRELKLITRRMQRGRIRSIEEGNYISTYPPFGYTIKKLENGRTLEPHPKQADIVKWIFEWYTHSDISKRIGTNEIAKRLNAMGKKTAKGREWQGHSVLHILKNPIYAGRIQWKRKEIKKSTTPGKLNDTRTRPRQEWLDTKGKHEPLITMTLFQKAQEVLKDKYHVPYQRKRSMTNPLAGLIKCSHCGASMVYRPYTKQAPHMKCYRQPHCQSKASNFELVEKRLLNGLRDWLDNYKAQWEKNTQPESLIDEITIKKHALASLNRELEEWQHQKSNLYDLLERQIYDEDTFLNRSTYLAEQIEHTLISIENTQKELHLESERQRAHTEMIPKIEHVLDLYTKTDDPKKKNALLKSVLKKAVYKKEKHQFKDDFELTLYPKITHTDYIQITY